MRSVATQKRILSCLLVVVMLLSYIPVTTWAVDTTTDIQAIDRPTGWIIVEDYDDYFGDTWVDQLGLPQTVRITLADGTKVDAPVTWDASVIDTRTTGYYSVPGEVTLPAGATNSQNLKASITIQVKEKKNLFANGDFEIAANSGPTGWSMPGIGTRFTTEFVRSGKNAGWARSSNAADVKRNGYNKDGAELPATVAQRVNAVGAGQYYFGLYARKGDHAATETFETLFTYRVGTQTSTPSNQRIYSNRITLTTQYQAAGGIVELPGDLNFVQMQFNFYKTDTTVTFDEIGAYVDDAELIALKIALKVEPAAIAEVKTQILSRSVVRNYPDYVGEDWKAALGLPEAVEILTDTGATASVDVTWDYSTLDFAKFGKYTLTGKLDDSSFPNPKGLTVTQNIYVGKAKNLISNPSFESDLAGWYLRGTNPSPSRVQSPVKDGSFAAMSGNWSASKIDESIADTRNMVDALTAAVKELGGGQFYYSIWAQASVANSMTVQNRLYYKTEDAAGNLSNYTITRGNAVAFSNKEYVQSTQVVELPANTAWLSVYLYATGATVADMKGDPFYIDHAQFIALNVTIPKDREPADVAEILDEIPVRAVVKNYDSYVGKNWQQMLGLPETVQVRTSAGNTAAVDVEWNFENLKLDKEGKYILVGTLDNSTYPNPQSLYVTQTIFVREYKNLITNSSFEGSFTGWYLRGMNPSPSVTNAVYKEGKYAAMTGMMSTTKTIDSIADTRKMVEALDAGVALQGGGQYYCSAWVQMASKTQIEGMKFQIRMNYKQPDANGELVSNNMKQSSWSDLTNKSFTQSSALLDIPADAKEVRMDLYISGQKAEDLCSTAFYIDYAELIPLNVIVEQYEGHMVQVESIIPDRQIIQNYPDYIGESYTTADLMLPETVKVRTSVGQVVDIAVRWNYSTLDLTKPGTYTVYGSLEEMKLANPNALTVKQKIKVVSKKNIFVNSSFEDDLTGWDNANTVTMQAGIAAPHRNGDFSLKMTVGRLDSYERTWIQAFYNSGVATVGQKITKSGAGRYYYGGWVHGSKTSLDIEVQMRLHYRCLSTGDTAIAAASSNIKLSDKEFLQVGDIVELPDDIYSAHMDLYVHGTAQQMALSELYLEDFELIPLNIEIPNLTDIIDCGDVADIYVHEGTSIEGLKLPGTLEVVIKNGQKLDLGVTWDLSSFDINKIGVQTIVGSLNLGKNYKNPKNFVPTAKVTIRPKGADLRQTIYISTSGDEQNDGLSPDRPKQDVKKIGTYLQQGYNVKLKRGDIWYIPTGGITLSQIRGTEDAPLTLGAYGSGELPIIGYLMKIENNAWKLVDANRNVYVADVSALGQRDGISAHRCFINDEAYKFKNRTNYVSLKAGEYCSYGGKLYIRMDEGAPRNVEVTPYSTGGTRLSITDVSYLNIEYIHFKGSSAYNRMIFIDAPTEYLKFRYCSITHCFYYIMMWESDDEQVHYKPEISNCYFDAMLNEAEGKENESPLKHWDVHSIEGITMRDGVDGAWIHNNHMRNMAHAFIAIESTERTGDSTTTGVRNCIIEDNLLEGVNAQYARAFNICGGFNLSGVQMCRDNTYRRNRCYDMTASSHLYGENNLIYSNLFSYVHSPYDEEGNILDGKGSQPWGFDSVPWSDHSSVGNMVVNNTFYNVSSAVGIYDQAHTVYNNLYANNLIVNWTSDAGANNNASGAFFDHSIDLQYVMNNGVFSSKNGIDHFVVDMQIYTAEDVNDAVAGYSGNICADPKFVNADLSNMEHGARLDFTLSNESPMRYAGLSLYADVYKQFPAWERMKADYTDMNGVVYLAESPSIGAFSFCEKIRGDVAEVGQLQDILMRPGATFEQLSLPDAVPAKNDQGVDVMLLATWNDANFDSSKPGTITLTASLKNGPHTDLNINGKTATINVNIKDRLELLNVSTVLDNITVLYGTSFADAVAKLPNTLDVMEESGFQEALPVSWSCDNYNPTKPDLYVFKCVLPEDMITNAREFTIEVEVRVLHEIGRGMELLVNPDFIDGTSAAPWKIGWGNGSVKITQDPQYLLPGEPAAAIVTVSRKYASLQQDALGQMKLMGDGQYLFKVYVRAYDFTKPIDTSYACLKVWGPNTYVLRTRSATNIGTDWVEFSAIMDVTDIANATEITFHTSTGKSDDDVEDQPKSYIVAGCSLIYLGSTDAEVEATLDSIDLNWNAIKSENKSEKNVMSDLSLPTKIGDGSKITWSSSDESVISKDGKVTMGRLPKEVTLTAMITYKGIETVKRYKVTVPRDPDLPTFAGSLNGDQTVKEGDEFKVIISLKSDKATAFSAYRITLSFNASKLEYVGISDAASTVTVDGGKLVISGIGTERPITDTITVTFKAKKSGITEVKLASVEMDLDPNVTLETLPMMSVADGAATIDVQKVGGEEAGDENTAVDSEKNDSSVVWIIIAVAAVVLIAGGATALILIKKKKQKPSAE